MPLWTLTQPGRSSFRLGPISSISQIPPLSSMTLRSNLMRFVQPDAGGSNGLICNIFLAMFVIVIQLANYLCRECISGMQRVSNSVDEIERVTNFQRLPTHSGDIAILSARKVDRSLLVPHAGATASALQFALACIGRCT